MKQDDLKSLMVGSLLWSLLVILWMLALFWAPVDVYQGQIYRIIYLHVPSAAAAFFAGFLLFITSCLNLKKPSEKYLNAGQAVSEVGLLFTVLTLATGSIWGKPTWGTWWTWDARLTTTFVLFLLYAAYLLTLKSMERGRSRQVTAAVLGILIFVDVPIIYKSVEWWRTLHQGHSLVREGGAAMSSEMLYLLLGCIGLTVLLMTWLAIFRAKNIQLRTELEQLVLGQ